jgi:hypothetical protein
VLPRWALKESFDGSIELAQGVQGGPQQEL